MACQNSVDTYSFRGICDIDDGAMFIQICRDRHTTVSKMLASLIHDYVEKNNACIHGMSVLSVTKIRDAIRERNVRKRKIADSITRSGFYSKKSK